MKKHLLVLSGLVLGGIVVAQNTPVSTTVQKRVAVLEELTGINCQYCPDGHKRANEIAAANPGKVVLVNIHAGGYATGSGFTTTAGTAIDGFLNPTGYPAGAVSRRAHSSDLTRLATGRGNWAGQVATVISEDSEVNVAIDASIDATTRQLTVKVELYYPTPLAGTTHYLNVGITQDNIESPQVNMSLNPDQVLPNGKYNNLHMFRMFINNSGTWGEPIDASVSGVITKTFTTTLPAKVGTPNLEIGNLHFYAFVSKGHNTVSNSQILSAAQTKPTYINVPAANANIDAILNDFNVACGFNGSVAPVVKVSNTGAAIASLDLSYTVNGITSTYTYNTPIEAFGSAQITLPAIGFPVSETDNEVTVTLTSVNNGAGTIGTATLSKDILSAASIDPATGMEITLNIFTDNYPAETSWEFLNGTTVVASGGPYIGAANGAPGGADALAKKSHTITIPAEGCYSVKLKDVYGDGVSYGNNTNGGVGFSIDHNGTQIYAIQKPTWDFGLSNTTLGALKVSSSLSFSEVDLATAVSVYPNPADNMLNASVNLENSSMVNFRIVNAQGQTVMLKNVQMNAGVSIQSLDVATLAAGIYTIQISTDGQVSSKPFIKK